MRPEGIPFYRSPRPRKNMPHVIQADRDYQVAASLFYLQRFDEALAKFRALEKDGNSSWRTSAPYLIGRALLWKARLTQNEKAYLQGIQEAENQFQRVLNDPRLVRTHAAAQRLMDRCTLVTEPAAGLQRLAGRLMQREGQSTRETDLLLYLNRLDYEDDQPSADDDLTTWLRTFQRRDAEAFDEALDRWHKSASNAWLYCAIVKAGGSPDSDLLIRAALKVPLSNPIGPAMRYQAARLLAQRERFAAARKQLEVGLSLMNDLPSARNRTLDLKFQLSSTMDEMLRLAPRRVILPSMEWDVDELNDAKDTGDWRNTPNPKMRAKFHAETIKSITESAALAAKPRLDIVGARVLSERLPLDALRTIASSPSLLPPHLTAELRLLVWTRAVLLGRFEVAREFSPFVAFQYPIVAKDLGVFAGAKNRTDAEVSAARVLPKLPGARPYLSSGYGRLTPVTMHDEWGRNWWYRFTKAEMYGIDLPYVDDESNFGRLKTIPPILLEGLPFLSVSQRQQSDREWETLRTSGERGLNWLAIRITDDVRAHPDKPDAAEVLYKVIMAAAENQWSYPPDYDLPRPGLQSAYELLSTRYKRSVWYQKIENSQDWLGWLDDIRRN